MSYGLPNEAPSGYRRTESSTLMNLHVETYLYLHSNSDMYMWNQVNYNQSHYANIGTSAPYNHCSYLKVPCPHHLVLALVGRERSDQDAHAQALWTRHAHVRDRHGMSGCRAFMGKTTADTTMCRCRGCAKRARSSGRAIDRANSGAEP